MELIAEKEGTIETAGEDPGEEVTGGVAVGVFEDVTDADGDCTEPTEGVVDVEGLVDELAPGLSVGEIEVETEGVAEELTDVEGEVEVLAPGLTVGIIE